MKSTPQGKHPGLLDFCVCVCVWTCVCVHVGVSIHVCISTPVHMCVCLWRPENNFGYCYSSDAIPLHIFFSNRVSHWPGTDRASKDAGSLSPRSHGPSSLCLPRARITGVIHSPNFFLAQVLRTLREVLVLALH